MTEAEVLVRASGLEKSFQKGGFLSRGVAVRAVAGLDIAIRRGEALGLVGESGSGKSTIGRLLLGLMPLSEGLIEFDGVPIAGRGARLRPDLRRRMQLVFQDPNSSLNPRRRIGPQIGDGLRLHFALPAPRIRARVAELLVMVGLDPSHADRYPAQFSGGQRQRIAIARALATNPDFLVADEPVSALDVSVQAQIISLLARLRAELGLSMLFISHDLPVVRGLCDRVVVLYLGRVMEEGPARALFDRPAHPYSRALISAAPTLERDPTAERIVLRGEVPSPLAPPSGCVFRTRCGFAQDACAQAVPPLRRLRDGRAVACLREDVTGN